MQKTFGGISKTNIRIESNYLTSKLFIHNVLPGAPR